MALGVLVVSALAGVLFDGDLDRLSRDELALVSPYLDAGARNGQGRGWAFVGTLDEAWTALPAAEQSQAANQLVSALRAQGVRDVMVFDEDDRLRIQALGEQPASILPSAGP